jgi:hypothetical protein
MSVYKAPERAEMTFVAVRHETGDDLEALGEGCRVAVAEELRRLADERMASFETYRACCSIPISQCRLCSTREHAACRAALDLRARADALDPEGATR